MLYAARVSVWLRWVALAVVVAQLTYRPEFWVDTNREFLFLLVPLAVFNGLIHYRLRRGWTVTWRWLLFLHTVDIALISGALAMAGDFDIMTFVAYFVALALFAVVFTSLWLCLAWTTMVALVYAAVSVAVPPGLDLAGGEEKALAGRIAAMYGIVGCVSLIARFERVRRRRSAERERELHRERIELSQAIHDTAAQTAYMVSMGIHRAMRLAGTPRELGTPRPWPPPPSLSKAAVWELRRPSTRAICSRGGTWAECSGRTPRPSRRSHRSRPRCARRGLEPPLPVEMRAGLFSIAHNALTNAFLHAQASRVEVRLDFDRRRCAAVRLGRRRRPARRLRGQRPWFSGNDGRRRTAGRPADRRDGRDPAAEPPSRARCPYRRLSRKEDDEMPETNGSR